MNNADDDFDFDDDGLDSLPADALDEIENTAIRATQHQIPRSTSTAGNNFANGDEDEIKDRYSFFHGVIVEEEQFEG